MSNLRLIYGADEAIAIWVGTQISHAPDFHMRRAPDGGKLFHAIGVSDGDKIIAGVVFHNYYPMYRNIELSMAALSPVWAKPAIIGELLHYPFIQLDCGRVTTLTPANNKRALRFNEHLGFIREGLVRKGYGDEDMIVCGMLSNEAEKWLKHYGQVISESASGS